MALHALPQHSHEKHLNGDRWVRVEEQRTADGGSISIRIDITDLKRREAYFRQSKAPQCALVVILMA